MMHNVRALTAACVDTFEAARWEGQVVWQDLSVCRKVRYTGMYTSAFGA